MEVKRQLKTNIVSVGYIKNMAVSERRDSSLWLVLD
jgi:hypothetical protein